MDLARLADGLSLVGHALVGRQDLPIPEWLFAWGASLVLIVSFAALSLAWHRSRFEEDHWQPVRPWLSRLIVNPVTEVLAGALGVFLLGVVVWSGLSGTEAPDRNFSLTFVFVTVLARDGRAQRLLRRPLSRLQPLARDRPSRRRRFKLIAGQSRAAAADLPRAPRPLARGRRHPRLRLARARLRDGGLSDRGLTPHTVAIATLVYSAYALVGMTLFGSDRWLERGEAFSVYFGMFASLAPLEVRDGTARPSAARWPRRRAGSPRRARWR